MDDMKPFDVPTTIPYTMVVLEKSRYTIQTMIPEREFCENVSVETYMDQALHAMVCKLVAEVFREEKLQTIPVEFTWFEYGDYKASISDIDSYLKWLHHGTYKEHKVTRYIDLNQYILYPSLLAIDEHELRYVYKCDWIVR
jgi:hypothetical protein